MPLRVRYEQQRLAARHHLTQCRNQRKTWRWLKSRRRTVDNESEAGCRIPRRTFCPANPQFHISNSAYCPNERLLAQLIEQRLGLLEIGSVEAFGEPVVDFGEHRTRFIPLPLLRQQAREAHGGAQLPCFGALMASHFERSEKT